MTAIQVNINGQSINPSSMTEVPEDRLFRSAWVVNGDVIEEDVDKAKPIAHEKVNEWRTAQKEQPFTVTGLGTFSADDESKTNIDGASQAALMAAVTSQPFSVEWSLDDDSTITLDGSQMMLVGQSLLAHVNAAHIAARAKHTLIEDATDMATIRSVLDTLV